MPDVDLFSGGGGAGFDEGWVEGAAEAEVGVTGGVHAQLCHGIDLGVDIGAAAEANARLRFLVLGARANVGVHARAGVRGRIILDPNVFERFGLTVRVEAAAEAAARARLEVALEAEYVAELAAEELDGLALELFLAFLREIRVGGGISGKAAFSAMARAWLDAAGRMGDDEDAGFSIGGGYAVGWKGGYGIDYFLNVGFENPRRFFSTSVRLIVDEIVGELEEQLPPGSELAIELFKLLVPIGLHAAYDVGQKSVTEGISTPQEIIRPFMVSFAEEFQRYLVDKAADFAALLVARLIEEALARLLGQEIDAADRAAVEGAVGALEGALSDGEFELEDVDEVLALGFLVAELADPEMMLRFRGPATLLWTATAVAQALEDVGDLVAGGEVSVLGFTVGARARIRSMPPVSSMPESVLAEYLEEVADFDGMAYTFDHAMDYLVNQGIGPLLADHAPELRVLLDRLHAETGISPGNMVTFGIQGVLGGPVTETELYRELRDFIRGSVDDILRRYVFTAFDEVAEPSPDARLYMDEVARPCVELVVSFVFDQLDVVLEDPSVLNGLEYLSTLQSGLSALLFKIVARNIVVLEQIASDTVRTQSVGAMATLEDAVREDDTHALMEATVDHMDVVLANLGNYVPGLPTATGLSDEQLAAVQTFTAEMLSIAQEGLGDDIFTTARWNRRREAILTLLLSLDAHFDWSNANPIAEAVDTMKRCAFVPDEQAVQDLLDLHLDLLVDQAAILLRRLPGPLADLVMALTGPQLEALGAGAAAAQEAAWVVLELAANALQDIRELIEQVEGLVEAAVQALMEAVEERVALLTSLTATTLQPAFVTRGQANIRDAGEALGFGDTVLDPIVNGFGAVLAGVFSAFSGVVDEALATVRTADFLEDCVAGALDGIEPVDLVAAGGPGDYLADAVEAFETSLAEEVEALLIPGGDADDALTITVPGPDGEPLVALAPSDAVELVVDGVLELIDLIPLVGPALTGAYHQAMESAYRAEESTLESAHAQADAHHEAVRARPGAQVEILSPAPLDDRPEDLWMYGPVVPLAVQVDQAGSGWGTAEEGRRIQVSVNGRLLTFPPSVWHYDAAAEELSLDTALRLDQEQLQPGLNVLEVSVAHERVNRVRAHVSFVVDPDGPLPDRAIRIDGEASSFDSPGSDHDSTYEEYVALRWEGTGRLDLTGWEIRDRARHRYVFGPTTLSSGQLLRLRTGGDPEEDDDNDRHWGRGAAVWNNDGDTVLLLDDRQVVRAQYIYRGGR